MLIQTFKESTDVLIHTKVTINKQGSYVWVTGHNG